jgi:GntR family transcriptional regulator, transcriptional repressor for pyruvate dehydrogenase complex
MKPIKKESIRTQVFERLRDQVIARNWPPGSKLPSENQLSLDMGVSRASIREGIQQLSALGLVDTRQGEGSFVRDFSSEIYLNALFPLLALDETAVFHVLEYRKVMEKGTVTLVVEKAGEDDIKRLEEAYAVMVRHKDDVAQFAKADLGFHLALAEASGNPIIAKINLIIRHILSVSMENIVRTLGNQDGLDYHRRILDAIEQRDAGLAERLMEEHVVRTMERFKHEKGPSIGVDR